VIGFPPRTLAQRAAWSADPTGISRSQQVSFFMPSYRGGGAEHVMVTLANGLADEGYGVDMAVCQTDGPVRAELGYKVTEVDLRARRLAYALPGLVRYLRQRRPTALLSTLSHANIVAVAASRLAGWQGRLVLRESTHLGALNSGSGGLKQRAAIGLVSWAYGRADAIVAGSEGMARDLRSRGVRGDLLHVIPNPIDVAAIRAIAQNPAGDTWLDTPGPPVVLGAGRLIRDKGFDLLLEAFARLRRQRPCRLVIVGEGPERSALETQIERLQIGDHVRMPGFVNPVFPWLARCTVFALSSRREGLPNVLIQALACGCRVVAADCHSGPAEILEAGKWGRLVAPGNADALYEGLSKALAAGTPTGPQPTLRAEYYDLRRILPLYREALALRFPA
jgi:glycosyltransferase involved in cell wall biosynthesis